MANVNITWHWIEWEVGYRWKRDILPQLQGNVIEANLTRCVYVIRANGNFAIRYPKDVSPVLYIGEGNFKDRIACHKNWLNDLIECTGEFPFQIAICVPRAPNNTFLYKDMEAALIHKFKKLYGCAPFANGIMEYQRIDHNYQTLDEFVKPLKIGRGRRFYWEIKPMRSNSFYDRYYRTHD